MDKKHTIVMMRHGESKKVALWAGKAIRVAGYKFDIAYTSTLLRAQLTAKSILRENGQYGTPTEETWRLNPRHYGFLTAMSRRDRRTMYSEAQVDFWRRSFDVPPPPIDEDHPSHSFILLNAGYQRWPARQREFPLCESLKMTIARTLPYWNDVIVPQIKNGKQILISAHGSSLLGIVKHLDQLSHEEIMGMKIPAGVPFICELDEELKPIENGCLKFLGCKESNGIRS